MEKTIVNYTIAMIRKLQSDIHDTQQSLYFTTIYFKTTLDYKTA